MRLHAMRGLTVEQELLAGGGGIGATCMVYSDDTPALIKAVAWASKAIYGDRVQICNGVGDEVEINAALTAIAAIGGTVLLSEGTFHMAATASVPANCMLRGMGWGTILECDAGGNCITITGDNVKVRDLKVDIVAGAGAGGTRPNCILADTRTNLELFGLWLVGDETVDDDASNIRQCGVVFDMVTYSSILNCVSQDHKRHGICLYDAANYNKVADNTCQGNTQHGIYLTGSLNNAVVGNECCGNAIAGTHLAGNSDGNSVAGNVCHGNTQQGLTLYGCDHNMVSGNTCSANTTVGIYLVGGSQRNAMTGNICIGNTEHGIYVTGSTDNVLTGNTVSGNGRHGIALVSGSNDNTVSGNSCIENDVDNTGSYDGISLSGSAANLISENACKDNDRWGVMVEADSDFNKVSNNYTGGNTSGSIRVNNANCDKNQLEFNTVEEGAPGNAGTATRSYGNYDPSADAFVGDVGAAPF